MILEDQELLFSLFHDGTIEEITTTQNGLKFSVDIMYLAEKIKPGFKNIVIELINLEDFYFEVSDSNDIMIDYQELNRLDLEILKTDKFHDRINIFCSANQGNVLGYLNIKTSHIEIYDPEGNSIELNNLERLCREYWDEFSLENKS
ncbi:MAG: hypothetical protein K0R55_2645 [Sporomusa sp.]|jgi:hypothetical protein|nr:hypothetical protein [Sporomusa sp.]